MRVIITAATNGEWMPSFQKINPKYVGTNKRFSVGFHESGIGMLASSISLMKMFVQETPTLIIQVGIAGCFDRKVPLGKVYAIKDDFAGDIGVMENKQWKDLFDLKLDQPNDAPYVKKSLPNPWLKQYNLLSLPTKKGVTVNTITTDKNKMELYHLKYKASIESMEGASLHYMGRDLNIPFIQLRAVSNYVGERNKAKWEMKEAIYNLNETLLQYLDALHQIA
ncbi:MAG: futalosine hydrolase [Chitinophagaceae bacterium]|jgi:futalosine hydrolase